MNLKRKLLLPVMGAFMAVAVVPTTQAAGTLTGQIGVQLIIGAGCTVANGNTNGGTNNWGNLDFGTYSNLTSIIDGTVVGSDGTNAVTVTCSTGLSPTLSLNGGLYGSGNTRSVSSNGGTTLIPYRLYSDSARTNIIDVNTPITLASNGSPQNIPIYGRIVPADQSNTAPAAGTYVDTVVATLAW